MKVKAHHIKEALAKKHNDDLFLTEVKNGPTHMANRGDLLILDALAIKRSWARPCFTGYEIKVSRQDFERDEKWPAYKELCHKFYFVCPTQLIQPEELPYDVGLIYYNHEKKSLYTRKKSIFRQIEISSDLLYYIIICRLESRQYPFFSSKMEYFEEWLNNKRTTRELGQRVRSKIFEKIKELECQVESLESENKWLKIWEDRIESIKQILIDHGVNVNAWNFERSLRKALNSSMPPAVDEAINKISSGLELLRRAAK